MNGIHDCKIEALQDAKDELEKLSAYSPIPKFIDKRERILSYISAVISDLEVENE